MLAGNSRLEVTTTAGGCVAKKASSAFSTASRGRSLRKRTSPLPKIWMRSASNSSKKPMSGSTGRLTSLEVIIISDASVGKARGSSANSRIRDSREMLYFSCMKFFLSRIGGKPLFQFNMKRRKMQELQSFATVRYSLPSRRTTTVAVSARVIPPFGRTVPSS